jgi:hypothetical protein
LQCVCCSLVCRSDLVEVLQSSFVQSISVAGPVLDKLANRKSLDLARFYVARKMGDVDPEMRDRIRIIS